MDTFSSSVSSSFKVPTIHPLPRQIHHFKTPNNTTYHLSTAATTTTGAKPTSTPFSHPKLATFSFLSPPDQPNQLPPKRTSPRRNAASGYAAALIDATICNNSLEAIEHDVKRFLKWLRHNVQLKTIMTDPFVGEEEKGRVIKEVVEKGRFQRHLVVLVKMLVDKNKLGMVGEVLDEFQRIYDELSGTLRVVLVPIPNK